MLYGRDSERAVLGELLAAARGSRSAALVLRGEAGIGKSALLDDTRDRATDMHVLSARGVEAESELPFAALHQLIRPALRHLGQLPPPQAAALSAALGLSDEGGQSRFLVFAGCLSLLSELAEQRPVLCLVDDAHWLDEASADALRFVARRLDGEGIVILFAAREDDHRGFEAVDLPSLEMTGLDEEAASILLTRGAGIDAAPAVRELLVRQTGGNALALVELPGALSPDQLAGLAPLPDVLPVPRQLEQVFLERARRLPETTQRLLLVTAADDSEDVGVVTRAAGLLGASADDIDAAEHAGLVAVHGQRLEFRHPLVRSAVYGAAASSERRAVHGALAESLADDDRHVDSRVWHLASSTIGDDDEVLRALDEAAERAEARNGHVAAAKALHRAADLSAASGDRGRRLARAARDLSLAGRDEEAVVSARAAMPLVTDPLVRAQLAEVEGRAALRSGRPVDSVPLLTEAARDIASLDPAAAIELLMHARTAAWQAGDRVLHVEIGQLAATIEPLPNDESSAYLTRALAGFREMTAGRTDDGARLLDDFVDWGSRVQVPQHALWSAFAAAWLADTTRFGELVDRAASLARERGELGLLADALGLRAVRLAIQQQPDEVLVAASEAAHLVRELGTTNLELLTDSALALIFAFQGRDEEARQLGERVLRLATAKGLRLRASSAVAALAAADVAQGRWSEAYERLHALLESGFGALDPVVMRTLPDKIEAAVRAGRTEDARAALSLFEEQVAYSRESSAPPRLAASQALLAAGTDASAHFEDALRLGTAAYPLDLARIHLLYGEHLRRSRRRTTSRVHFRAALDGFERLGAEPWAERARSELRASGETARKRDPSTIGQLTPQELQVARFVAEGLSNKEVAAQLFLSPRTIDAHLRNVFSKLGVTSRTQLARLNLEA